MAPATDRWLSREAWQLQSVIDSTAYAFDLPLQAIDLTACRDFYSLLFEAAKVLCNSETKKHPFEAAFPTQDSFKAYVADVVRTPEDGIVRCFADKHIWQILLNPERCPLWKTRPSYENPLLHVLREHWGWIWWETLWFYDRFSQGTFCRRERGGSEVDDFRMPGFPGKHFSIRSIDVPELDISLIAFPTFEAGFASGTQPDAPARAAFVDEFKKVVKRATPKGLRYDDGRIARLAGSRSGATNADTRSRLFLAREAIAALSRSRMAPDIHLTDPALRNIAVLAIMATQGADRRREALKVSPQPDFSAFVANPPGHVGVVEFIVSGEASENGLKVEIEIGRSPDFGADVLGRDILFPTEPDKYFDRNLSVVIDRINTCKHAFVLENHLLMRTWLNDNFGDLVPNQASAQNPDQEEKQRKLSRRICRWAAKLFDANICTLSRYDYKSTTLDLLGFHHSDPFMRDAWAVAVREALEGVHADPERRSESVSYCCIEKNGVIYEPRHEPGNPRTEYGKPEGGIAIRSSIAVPIEILGRSWGVLSIFGERDDQFDGRARDALQDFAGLLSTHYYHQSFLRSCQQLDVVGLDTTRSEADAYKQACDFLCDTLLVESATLWLPSPQDPREYHCEASVNRPDLARSLHLTKGKPIVAKESLVRLNRALEANDAKWMWHPAFFEGLELESGKALPKFLAGEKYKSWCQVAIYAHPGRTRSFVTLLSRSDEIDNAQWHNISQIVRNEIALFIRAVRSRADWDETERSVIAHELDQRVAVIAKSSEELLKLIDVDALIGNKHKHYAEYTRLRAEINEARDELMRSMKKLSTGTGLSMAERAAEGDPVLTEAYGFKTPTEKAFDFKPFLERLVSAAQTSVGRKVNVKLTWPLSGPFLYIEPDVLRPIFANLCTNAVKYAMPHTDIHIKLLDYSTHLKICIKNEGQPLQRAEIGSLFFKGFRGESARLSNVPGHGYGLFYAKMIANRHKLILEYVPDPKDTKTALGTVFHEFCVTIPEDLVRT